MGPRLLDLTVRSPALGTTAMVRLLTPVGWSRARELGISVRTRVYGAGRYAWSYWERELRRAVPILLETGLTREGLLRRDHLADTLRRHRAGERDYSNRLWTAMSLNLWHERWIGATAAASAA